MGAHLKAHYIGVFQWILPFWPFCIKITQKLLYDILEQRLKREQNKEFNHSYLNSNLIQRI